jgi:hypothetical protein
MMVLDMVVCDTKMAAKTDKDRGRFATKKQTKVPPELLKKFRMKALEEDKDVRDVYDEAIYDFFGSRREHLQKSSALDLYHAAPSNAGIIVNIQMDDKTAAEIEKIAEKDSTSGSRILYTCLLQFAKKKGLI